MKTPTYDGRTNLDEFLIKFKTVADYNRWSSTDKAAHLKVALTGVAAQMLWDTVSTDDLTFEQIESKLIDRFGSAGQREFYATQLRARRRRPNENLHDLYSDVKRLMALAYARNVNSEMGGFIARDHFVTALNDPQLEMKVREKEPIDLEQALKAALRAEVYLKACNYDRASDDNYRRDRRDDKKENRRPAYAVNRIERQSEPNSEVQIAQLKREIDDMKRTCDQVGKDRDRYRLLVEQRRADEIETIRHAPSLPPPSNQTDRRNSQWKDRGCFNCGRAGHFRRNCPDQQSERDHMPPSSAANNRVAVDTVERTSEASAENCAKTIKEVTSRKTDVPTYLKAQIGDRNVCCLIDTGSEVCLFPTSLASDFNIEPDGQRLYAANGTVISIAGRVSVPLRVGTESFIVRGLVSDHAFEVILGVNFLIEQCFMGFFARRIKFARPQFQT